MRSHILFAVGFTAFGAAVVLAQTPAPAPAPANLQAAADPRYAEVIARCKTPPPGRGGGAPAGAAAAARAGGGGAAAPGGPPAGTIAAPGRGTAAAAPATPGEYTVTAIPGVIAAGQRWATVYETTGNNADGIIASEDGGLLLAQNDNGVVIKLDRNNQVSTLHRNTNTGGALARNSKGALFLVSRGLEMAVLQLEPTRRVHANMHDGDPIVCRGGINDLTADSKGGVYFTQGILYYADPKGVVTAYGQDLRTNGLILSPDEKTLYVTNGATVAAFDVRPDGTLTNQREFAKLPSGSGDGLAVDAAGRLYVTLVSGPPGLHVFAPDGNHVGLIPAPRNLITAAFAGPDKKTLYAVANDRRDVDVYAIPMIAQGVAGRAK
jgi:gluconolactonase